MHKSLNDAIFVCDSKRYVFKAKAEFAEYDMSEAIKKRLPRHIAASVFVKWDKRNNSYTIDADVKIERDFLDMIENFPVFKSWIKR